MSHSEYYSSICFTDGHTVRELENAAADHGIDERDRAAVVGKMFDSTKLRIESSLECRRSCEKNDRDLNAIHSTNWEQLHQSITGRIVNAVRVLNNILDLSSKEWKNAPAIWQMLSFSSDILHSANTPLPQALRAALDQVRGELQPGVDAEELIDDLDEVIHQTSARRSAIQNVIDATLNVDLTNVPILKTAGLSGDIHATAFEQARHQLAMTGALLTVKQEHHISADNAPVFALHSSEVRRVDAKEPLTSAVGNVYLVRSKNVSALGDHYIVITGAPVMKPHGLRPQDISYAVRAGQATPLDDYPSDEQLVLLKLNDAARLRFYDTYNVDALYRCSTSSPQ